MFYTASVFKEKLPKWKQKRDAIADRFIYRKISFYVAAFCANRGISANSVSVFSVVIAILSAVFISIPTTPCGIIGALLFIFWIILDDTDGNLARVVKSQKYGEFLDALSSYILIGTIFISLGIRSYYNTSLLSTYREIFLICGAFTSSFGVLMSLIYQKYVQVSLYYGRNERIAYDGSNSNKLMRLRTFVDMNLGVGGVLPIFILLGIIFECTGIIVILWFFFHTFEFIGTVIFFLFKIYKNNK